MGLLDRLFGKTRSREDPNKDVLLMVIVGNVYSWDGYQVRKAGGTGITNCIAEHKNEIFEGTLGGVNRFTPAGSKYTGEWVAEGRSVMAMCSNDATLYDATFGSPGDEKNEIHETLTDRLVATRESRITALTSHRGTLYDGGWYGICDTFTGRTVSNEPCEALCPHNDNLYAVLPSIIIDVFSGEKVAMRGGTLGAGVLCSDNYRLVDFEGNEGVIDVLKKEVILPYGKIEAARGKRGMLQIADMISVNGLTYIAATKGEQAALDTIAIEYQGQLSDDTVRSLQNTNLGFIRVEVMNVIQPGTELWPGQAMFMPNLLAGFKLDPRLGVIHGDGRGHSIIRVDALRYVLGRHHNITDYVSLLKAFFEEGYHIKRVGYIHFHSS